MELNKDDMALLCKELSVSQGQLFLIGICNGAKY